MKTHLQRSALLLLGLVCVIGLGVGTSSVTAFSRADSDTVSSPIILDPPYGFIRLDPPAATDLPKLSAAEAVSRFQRTDPDFVMPADATEHLGRYTAGVGDGSFRYRDQLAWGVRYHQCAIPRHPVSATTRIPCTRWVFLDADTGQMLEAVYQQSDQ